MLASLFLQPHASDPIYAKRARRQRSGCAALAASAFLKMPMCYPKRAACRRPQPPIRGTEAPSRSLQLCEWVHDQRQSHARDRRRILAAHCHGHPQPCVGAKPGRRLFSPIEAATQLVGLLPAVELALGDDKRSLASGASHSPLINTGRLMTGFLVHGPQPEDGIVTSDDPFLTSTSLSLSPYCIVLPPLSWTSLVCPRRPP